VIVVLSFFINHSLLVNCRSSQYSNHYCADYASQNYNRVVSDGYIMGVWHGLFGSDTQAFYKGAGVEITHEIQNSLVHNGKNYRAEDCAHFVSSSLINGSFSVRDNFPPAKGIVGANELYDELRRVYPELPLEQAINKGDISVGDPVFMFNEKNKVFHSAVYVGNDEIAYHTECKKVKYYEIEHKKVAVHITHNSDDASDTNNKFRQYMHFAVTQEATPYLNVRENPGLKHQVISRKTPGERGKVIGGPEFRDGYYWWNVRFNADGLTGWCAGQYIKRN
jgi:hypothetical protein